MLKIFIGGPVWGKKYRAGAALLPYRSRCRGISKPLTTFFQHTFLHLLPGKLGFALYGGKSSLYGTFSRQGKPCFACI
jgi:hypothetical protein